MGGAAWGRDMEITSSAFERSLGESQQIENEQVPIPKTDRRFRKPPGQAVHPLCHSDLDDCDCRRLFDYAPSGFLFACGFANRLLETSRVAGRLGRKTSQLPRS